MDIEEYRKQNEALRLLERGLYSEVADMRNDVERILKSLGSDAPEYLVYIHTRLTNVVATQLEEYGKLGKRRR